MKETIETIPAFPDYKPPRFLKSKHCQTVFPTLFRHFRSSFYVRERIPTPDDDFLDIDWSLTGSDRLVVISHGMEGNSKRAYVVGMVRAFRAAGWDALAWNFRGSSGEVNRQLRFYHAGCSDDLQCVLEHAKSTGRYKSIALIGFSLGGNLSLFYLGQNGQAIDPIIKGAVVFSVPCDLRAGAKMLALPSNRFYWARFRKMFHTKVKAKMGVMPDKINDDAFANIKSLADFDNNYTAPLHGFKDADDYWEKCSSNVLIPNIKVPTLIVNSKDDPFLTGGCFPIEEAAANGNVTLEMPDHGGHVGFMEFNLKRTYWSEKRAVAFLNSVK